MQAREVGWERSRKSRREVGRIKHGSGREGERVGEEVREIREERNRGEGERR